VLDWHSGAPMAGARCQFGLRSTSGLPSWDTINVAISDVDGRFTLEGVPASAIAVECKSDDIQIIPGGASLALTEGQVGSVEVALVERSAQSPGLFGADFDTTAFLGARIVLVQPHTPADRAGLRAGDLIATVDGRSVASVMPYVVGALIVDHGPGAEVRVGIVRNGAQSTVSLVLGPPIAY
ncbi:MAG TPA: PDZ domain-containing protein, partial [Polyangia bacterium]